jgi:hypothetical protein
VKAVQRKVRLGMREEMKHRLDENPINPAPINLASVEMVMETICKQIGVPVSYNLVELVFNLKKKKLIKNSEIKSLFGWYSTKL